MTGPAAAAASSGPPRVSVVIPTYNRSALLRRTLTSLTRAHLPVSQFEVIVADDGSSDDTRAVAAEFGDRLRVGYHFQDDLGFRAGAARNAGARLATAPLLVFLDTGAVVGPDFLTGHLAAHAGPGPDRVVLGYAYGYDPENPVHDLDQMSQRHPEDIVAEFRDDPAFRDIRHDQFAECDFDLHRRAIPWNLLFTINCSVPAEQFWAVGGFDEKLTGWGGEDLELGYQLHRRGLRFQISRTAWVIELPHERPDIRELLDTFRTNVERSLARHPDPVLELGWALIGMDRPFFDWDAESRRLEQWRRQVHDVTVAAEIAAALRHAGPDDRVVVLGAGAVLPPAARPLVAMDFDGTVVDRLTAAGAHAVHHAVGLRTPLGDRSADLVVVTSRLAGLWQRWHEDLAAEADRLGGSLRCTFTVDTAQAGTEF